MQCQWEKQVYGKSRDQRNEQLTPICIKNCLPNTIINHVVYKFQNGILRVMTLSVVRQVDVDVASLVILTW